MFKNEKLAYWCIVKKSKLLLLNGNLPLCSIEQFSFDSSTKRLLGHFEGKPVFWFEATNIETEESFGSLRELLWVDAELFSLAGKAIQLSYMLMSQRFCGCCGQLTVLDESQFAMLCNKCGNVEYPRISPCVIVAVRKDNAILLAQHSRHKSGIYTVISGFVEAGETLEQCVAREVLEETGITVTNVRYFGSQPWAFPSNLMMGFTAEYKSGELTPDDQELSDALWATADNLPDLPPTGTIARQLIEFTLAKIAG